jgi:proline iminopeptidase
MDQLADDFITSEILKTCVYHKTFTHSREFRMEGMGWWASAMTIFDLMNILPVKETLSKNTTPVLVLRGNADYLQSGIAEQYTTVFSNSKLVRIRKAGHFIWLDQPKRYQREIEKFLF